MLKKSLIVMLLAAVCLVGNAFAVDYWAASGTEGNWYSPDGVALTAWGDVWNPWYGHNAYIAHGSTVTYDGANSDALSLTGAWVSTMYVGSWSAYTDPTQDTLNIINNGSLNQDAWTYLGAAAGDVGVVNIDATSAWNSTSVINVGYNGSGEVNVYGDLVAEFNAGAGGLFIDNQWSGADTGSGVVNVYDGADVSAWIEVGPNGAINIEQGGTISLLWDYWGTSWKDYFTPLIGSKLNVIGDGEINIAVNGDVTEITVVPEPATMCLLGLGGLLALKRKRK